MQADQIKEKEVGMDKNEIRKAISCVKLEDEEEHARNIHSIRNIVNSTKRTSSTISSTREIL